VAALAAAVDTDIGAGRIENPTYIAAVVALSSIAARISQPIRRGGDSRGKSARRGRSS